MLLFIFMTKLGESEAGTPPPFPDLDCRCLILSNVVEEVSRSMGHRGYFCRDFFGTLRPRVGSFGGSHGFSGDSWSCFLDVFKWARHEL